MIARKEIAKERKLDLRTAAGYAVIIMVWLIMAA